MKSVLLSVRPEWVAKILNKEKTIEVRKRFPKDYVGWVYIYCTKEQGLARLYNGRWNDTFVCEKDITDNEFKRMYSGYDGKGKVVARFWCDKVEEIYNDSDEYYECYYQTDTLAMEDLCEQSCLNHFELNDYLQENNGYAIHITKLEIFNKPKEISEFKQCKCFTCKEKIKVCPLCFPKKPLTRAPQSYCFIEV